MSQTNISTINSAERSIRSAVWSVQESTRSVVQFSVNQEKPKISRGRMVKHKCAFVNASGRPYLST